MPIAGHEKVRLGCLGVRLSRCRTLWLGSGPPPAASPYPGSLHDPSPIPAREPPAWCNDAAPKSTGIDPRSFVALLAERLITFGEPGCSDLNEIDGPKLVVRVQRGDDVMSDESPVSDNPTGQPAEVPSGPPDMAAPGPGSPTGRTRISGVWVGVIIGVVVLVLDLVFIIQNSQSVKVSFFSGSVNMPLGVALLLAAVGGVLLAGIVASLRIWQLRHRLHNRDEISATRS